MFEEGTMSRTMPLDLELPRTELPRTELPRADVPRTEAAPRTGRRTPARRACPGGAGARAAGRAGSSGRDRAPGAGRIAVRRAPGAGGGPGAGRAAADVSPRDARMLLRQAAEQLAEAHREIDPLRRYPAAYLAALRAGAAVLALRARPRPRRGAPRDVWRLLTEVAPELGEWAVFFASCSRTRLAAEAGIDRMVAPRDADDLLRQAEQFLARVRELLPD